MMARPNFYVTSLLITSLIIGMIAYLPGLSGPWLVDDDINLGIFNTLTPTNTPYADLISENTSGPLGRPVAMASFALNHALGLFDTTSLKAGNLLLHLLNGLLLFFLMHRLLQIRPASKESHPPLLPALIAAWWLLLPLHVSSVLYIVQRMTLLASFFSLAACLTYIHGRLLAGTWRGNAMIAVSLLLLLPLAALSKESAFATLPWLVLIELFFFSKAPLWREGLPRALTVLVTSTIVALAVTALALNITADYLAREFTLEQRLLTQGRVIWGYIRDIFLPSGGAMGLFHDDFPISVNLWKPVTTLPALAGLASLLLLSLRLSATRWWPVAFGILFFLSGHLVESTIVPLELYFEHRNYLPSAGLLLAAASALLIAWPSRKAVLMGLWLLYVGILALATWQRSHIWANKSLLLETSARHHPHSLRAWTDYSEDLLENRRPRLALEAALAAAQNNPGYASISYMQMMSVYCRIQQPVPAPLVKLTADALLATNNMASTITTPLSIGLELILTEHQRGHCPDTDFTPLISAFVGLDAKVVAHYGSERRGLWLLRLTLAEWLLELNKTEQALPIMDDIWRQGDHDENPTAGLALAKALAKAGHHTRAIQVLAELETVTHDAPDYFRLQMSQVLQDATGAR